MASGVLGTAVSGLLAAQRQLATTGHNISNVNTEGYSRQRVILGTRDGQLTGAGFIGKGVDAVGIERVYSEFLSVQVRNSASAHSEIEAYHALAAQVDNFIADPSISLTPVMQSFFNSVNEVADDPTSIPARQVMLTNAETLADRFVTMEHRLSSLRSQVNQNAKDVVNEINSLADSIAQLNQNIVIATGQGGGNPPNDLLDARDRLLDQLSEKVDVSTVEQSDGSLSVFIGNGQSLVLGIDAATLTVQNSSRKPEQLDIVFTTSTSSVVITQNIAGGELTGILKFREEILDPAQQALGRVAAGLAIDFNDIHDNGYDLNGNTQLSFFGAPAVTVVSDVSNTGSISADYADVNDLVLSDYRLDYDGTNYLVTRLSDNTQVYNNPGNTFIIDGVSVDASGAVAGDSFFIRPTQNVAGAMSIAISNPEQIAASLSDTALGSVGDNQNALALAALETNKNLLNGTATFQDAYGQAVVDVGTLTRAAEINSKAQEGLLNQALASKDAVTGVNLDEEAANLIRFQQAYQAAAQVVSVTSEIFDTLLGAIRR